MAAEIKEVDVRNKARSSDRNHRRFAYRVIDGVPKILERLRPTRHTAEAAHRVETMAIYPGTQCGASRMSQGVRLETPKIAPSYAVSFYLRVHWSFA